MTASPCAWIRIVRRLFSRTRSVLQEVLEIRESLEEIGEEVSQAIEEVSAELHGGPAPKREKDRSGAAAAEVAGQALDEVGNEWTEYF